MGAVGFQDLKTPASLFQCWSNHT